MKVKNIKWFLLMLCLPFLTGCDWEELPAYDGAEITAVQLWHKYLIEGKKDPMTGEPVVEEKQLSTQSVVDSEAGTINVTVTVPAASGTFTESIRNEVAQSKLWGQVTCSTAARITPLDGTQRLGTPDDWTQPRKFQVMAANGDKKVWTITVVAFNK